MFLGDAVGWDCEVHHPGVQHSASLAEALASRQRLHRLVTRFQVGADPGSRLLRVALERGAVAERLRARVCLGVPDELIERRDVAGLALERLVRRLPSRVPGRTRMFSRLDRRFQLQSAGAVALTTRFVVSTDHASRWSFEYLAEHRPDVLRVLDVAHPFTAAGSRYVVADAIEHGLPIDRYDEQPADERTIREARQELFLADRILVASTFTASSLLDEGVDPTKVSIVPYGIAAPDPVPTAGDPRDRPCPEVRLLFIGALSERKGLTVLVRALKVARSAGLPITLEIIGRPIRAYPVDDLKGHEGCRYLGAVGAEEHSAALARAHYLVLPSICEGFGRVLLEALRHGAGVVTTERSAGPDLALAHPDAPIKIVPTSERDRLADVFGELVSEVEVGGIDTSAARRCAAAYSHERYAQRLDELLRKPAGHEPC